MKPDFSPKKPVVFSKPLARRVGRATRRVEHSLYVTDQRVERNVPWNPGVLRAVVTTAIPTGTSSVPSTAGKCTLQRWDPVAATSSAETHADFTAVRCCNDHTLSASIAVGKCIKVAWIDGDLWLISADCP
jgi:hypothetical protein